MGIYQEFGKLLVLARAHVRLPSWPEISAQAAEARESVSVTGDLLALTELGDWKSHFRVIFRI